LERLRSDRGYGYQLFPPPQREPKGELTVETAQGLDGAKTAAAPRSLPPEDGLWPSYNRTLTSDRFSSLNEINRENAGRLKVLCTYDTGQYTGFNSGLLMVDGALLFATEYDTFSIDPITCRENWRKHEIYAPATPARQEQLSGAERRGADSGQRSLLWRYGRQFLRARYTGRKLWGEKIGGAVGGGVITFTTSQGQRVDAATGLTEILAN
jgi:hypothetical protein